MPVNARRTVPLITMSSVACQADRRPDPTPIHNFNFSEFYRRFAPKVA
jgi:hypothetical protein